MFDTIQALADARTFFILRSSQVHTLFIKFSSFELYMSIFSIFESSLYFVL